jgi:hypothetical protein
MAQGRRREMRTHAVAQAVLVWSLSDMDEEGIAHYLRCGEIHTNTESPHLPFVPGVDEKVAEIQKHGRLIVGGVPSQAVVT